MKLHRSFLGLALLGVACTSGGSAKPPPPAPEPIRDSAPYLCTFVPEHALRIALNVEGPLPESDGGTMEDGLCTVPPNAPYILLVNWMQENETWTDKKLNRLLNIKKTIYTADNGIKLPVDLGDGMAAKVRSSHPNQPYEMAAKFRCGGKERYFSFAFAEFAKGRDSFKDMTELMRIAQKRYAALHKCELGQ